MLVRLTSCAASFVELSSKPRPKSEEPLQLVAWEGMAPRPLSSSAIENFDTPNDTTAIVQSIDYQFYAKSRPFVISFFDANRKLVAVLSGKRPPTGLGYLDTMRAETCVLYSAAPPPAAAGHATRTTSDGSTLYAVAELRPIFSADFVAQATAKPGEETCTVGDLFVPPYPWEIGLYLAGPGGTFHADPAATAPTAEGVPPFSLQPPDLRMRLAPGGSASDYPISAIVVNARRNPVAVLQQARKRHPA